MADQLSKMAATIIGSSTILAAKQGQWVCKLNCFQTDWQTKADTRPDGAVLLGHTLLVTAFASI